MSNGKIYPIVTQAGIKRDGTEYAGNYYIDGQWCRFQRGIPKKMGGYKELIRGLSYIPRGIYITSVVPNFNVYISDRQSLKFLPMDQFGNQLGPLIDRTPVGFQVNDLNVWSFDIMYSTVNAASILIAYAAPNLGDIGNDAVRPIYYGNVNSNAPLTPTGQSVTGGIVVLHPYLFMFGSDGNVQWSNVNDPLTILNSARITGQKVVAGMPMRAGNSSPGGLFWSLDSLIRVTKAPAGSVIDFIFDTVTNESSILSSRSVVEYDGKYFWAAADRFLLYNGVCQEVPNQMNLNYFYQNLNYSQRQKVWATKVPQYGEIWWYYPSGNNTECDRAVVYNLRENSWYDTLITRGCGYFEQVFADPIWADNAMNGFGNYSVWIHEIGVDRNQDGIITAIDSFFETGDVAWSAIGPSGVWTGADKWVDLYRFEPDFLQSGEMTLTVNGREYARSPVVSSVPYSFLPDTIKIDLREQRRLMTLRFRSNIVGGNYEMGQVMLTIRTGDTRP